MDYYDYTYLALVLILLIILLVLRKIVGEIDRTITALRHSVRDKNRRDEKRVYLQSEKVTASQRCGWRCEGTGVFFRCRHEGRDLQGDHWYPHARGGATTQSNLVMLCPRCNKKKSAHIPTRAQTRALSRRRRKYIHHPELITPGQWLDKNYYSPAPARSRHIRTSSLDW